MKLLIIFIISVVIFLIAKLPILEAVLMSIGIILICKLRVFLLFIILVIALLIYECSIKTAVIVAGGIALSYWVGIILFTEHKSQTWMNTKEPWHLNTIKRANNRVVSKTYKESTIDMFFENRKNKKNKNIQENEKN